jgi:hypothetical protein
VREDAGTLRTAAAHARRTPQCAAQRRIAHGSGAATRHSSGSGAHHAAPSRRRRVARLATQRSAGGCVSCALQMRQKQRRRLGRQQCGLRMCCDAQRREEPHCCCCSLTQLAHFPAETLCAARHAVHDAPPAQPMSAPQWRVPPLRFERALLEEGPLDTLPAPARGSKRVLGQTLSPSARRVFDDARERFVEQASISRGAGGAAPQWASVLSKLPSAVDEAALLHALRLHLRLPQARSRLPPHARAVHMWAHALAAPHRPTQPGCRCPRTRQCTPALRCSP